MTGNEVVLHGQVVPAQPPPAEGAPEPTSREEVILADLRRGVPPDALAAEWGLDPAVIDYLHEKMQREPTPNALEPVPNSYDRLLARLDLREGDPEEEARHPHAFSYQRERLAPRTRAMYRYYAGRYLDYCAATGRREVPGHRFTIEAFAIFLTTIEVQRGKNKGRFGLSPSSMAVALSAVAALHRACGENLPDRDLARGIIERHAKQRKLDRVPDGVGSPGVDLPTFAELVAACDPDTPAGIRDRAMLTLGLNIMARRSELTTIDRGDVTYVRKGGRLWLQVHVPYTKTGKDRTALVPAWDDPVLDPHRAWDRWTALCDANGIEDGPAFRAVDRWGNIQGARAQVDGKWLPKGWAGRSTMEVRLDPSLLEHIILRAALKAAVENADELRPHGVLRRTGATLAYLNGADILSIARQGGWGDRSPVVFRYIGDAQAYERNAMLLVGQSNSE